MHITREEINSIDFDNHFKNICCENDKNEFFGTECQTVRNMILQI